MDKDGLRDQCEAPGNAFPNPRAQCSSTHSLEICIIPTAYVFMIYKRFMISYSLLDYQTEGRNSTLSFAGFLAPNQYLVLRPFRYYVQIMCLSFLLFCDILGLLEHSPSEHVQTGLLSYLKVGPGTCSVQYTTDTPTTFLKIPQKSFRNCKGEHCVQC